MLKKILLLLNLFFVASCHAYQYDLAICAISKDDEPYLKEWIEFHKLVGVQHFYIYCHGNWDRYSEVLKDYIESEEVDLLSTQDYTDPAFNTVQCQSYTDLLVKVRHKVKWLAVIDIDEFLFSPTEHNLQTFLSKYEKLPNVGGISANWHLFGTSWIPKVASNQTLIESLTLCTPEQYPANAHVKTIVRPQCVSHYDNPHYPIYFPGIVQTNTDGVTFFGALSPYIQHTHLKINHYWTRDQDFFWNYKVPRQSSWGIQRTEEQNREVEIKFNNESNTAILPLVPPLRKQLGLKN